MSHKLRIKFLLVIWGERYIDEFSLVSLPSLLAPGNIPCLAEEADLEILIMTTQASVPALETRAAIARLKSHCDVRYILIDDLVGAGAYGVTLTLGFARGILDSGAEQTDTCFVFMNSDFVLADGSLRTVLRRLSEGHHCIMAPSLRANSEAVFPELHNRVGSSGTLAATPRDLVGLTLANLHPTVIGKTITQGFVTCKTYNQIYWQVDETTLLGRYHLAFMLAIRPERPMHQVNSYCDYGFVPELVPSGSFTLLGDSDEFFMLEMQSEGQERSFQQCGRATPGQIAAELSSWTTREHRRYAEINVVFKSADPPPQLEREKAALGAFVSDIHTRMAHPPLSHVDHYYWMFGVQSWQMGRPSSRRLELPPELRPDSHPDPDDAGTVGSEDVSLSTRLLRRYTEFLSAVRRRVGVKPNVPIWHHQWLDSQLVLDWLADVASDPHAHNLMVCNPSSTLSTAFMTRSTFDIVSDIDALLRKGGPLEPPENGYDAIFFHIDSSRLSRVRALTQSAGCLLAPSGTLAVYIDTLVIDVTDPLSELSQSVGSILPGEWLGYRITAAYAGGTLKRLLRLLEIDAIKYLRPVSAARLPYSAVATCCWPVVAALTALNNLRCRGSRHLCPRYCTSVLLTLSRTMAGRTDREIVAPAPSAER